MKGDKDRYIETLVRNNDRLSLQLEEAKIRVLELEADIESAISSLKSQVKYIADDIQALGHGADAIRKLQSHPRCACGKPADGSGYCENCLGG